MEKDSLAKMQVRFLTKPGLRQQTAEATLHSCSAETDG